MSESAVPIPRPSEPVTVLPDGSAFFVGTLPLPSDHWLYAPEYQPPPMGLRMSVSNPQRIEMVRHVKDAVRWAVRGATMKGTVADFDPDALVQNAVVGLLGYFAKDALSTDAWANPSPVPDETFVVRSPSVPTATQEHAPKCECGKVATCYGAYENQEPDFACDDCCGHGNEDGWCKDLSDLPRLMLRLREFRASEEAANSDTPDVISQEDVDAIEQDVGMGAGAWDMVPPESIILATLRRFRVLSSRSIA